MSRKEKESKPHIGIFGRRNAGKSSFINLLAGKEIAIVSGTPGTTTDPVKKPAEIFGIGPAIMIDTAGIDETGDLGSLRVRKTMQVIRSIDLAVILLTDNKVGDHERELVRHLKRHEVPYFFIHNKADLRLLTIDTRQAIHTEFKTNVVEISTTGIDDLDPVLSIIKKYLPAGTYTQPSLLERPH